MTHLTPEEFIDAIEGSLAPSRTAHIDTCATCGAEAERLRAVLLEAQSVDPPEPSPLFWDQFSTRVHAAVASDAADDTWIPRWLRWPVLVPLTALSLLVLALITAIPRHDEIAATRASAGGPAAAGDFDLATLGDSEWAVVTEMIGPLDLETAHEAGIVLEPGDADRVALELSAAERQELVRLLKEAIEKPRGQGD